MMQQIVTRFPMLGLSCVALLIFFTFFVLLIVMVNLKPQMTIQKRAAELPLEDGLLIQESNCG
jgi:hypothetical protein